MKTFRKALQRAGFPITAEISLCKQTTVDEAMKQAGVMAGSVDAIQVAESPDGSARVAPHALASLLISQGIDVIPRMHCRDRNRIALQSDLLGLRALGVSSLILNKGNQLPTGKELSGKAVFELSCRELIAMAHAMNEEEWSDGDHELVIGTEATAFAPATGWKAESLQARSAAGARFLQTQPCFDLDLLRRYMQGLVEARLTWSYSVIVTLAPLHSADTEQEGIEICAELMREAALIPGVSGINLLTLGNPGAVVAAINASGLPPDDIQPCQHQDNHQ